MLVEAKGISVCTAVAGEAVVYLTGLAVVRRDVAFAVVAQRESVRLAGDGLAGSHVPVVDDVLSGSIELHSIKGSGRQHVSVVYASPGCIVRRCGDHRRGDPLRWARHVLIPP